MNVLAIAAASAALLGVLYVMWSYKKFLNEQRKEVEKLDIENEFKELIEFIMAGYNIPVDCFKLKDATVCISDDSLKLTGYGSSRYVKYLLYKGFWATPYENGYVAKIKKVATLWNDEMMDKIPPELKKKFFSSEPFTVSEYLKAVKIINATF